jgi:hypothetical protein
MLGFGALFILGWYMMSKTDVNKTYIFAVIGIFLLVIILRTNKAIDKQPIPENIIKIIGANLMRRKVGVESNFPTGTIVTPTGYCKMRFEGEWGQPFKPWKWEVGFKVIQPTGLKKTVLVLFHPYEGYITGIEAKPAGYGGELGDLKVLIPQIVKDEPKKP